MLLILSLFLVCVIVGPSLGLALRRRQRMDRHQRRVDALLRDSPIADYRPD